MLRYVDDLHREDLQDIIAGQTLALTLRVLTPTNARRLADQFESIARFVSYDVLEELKRFGRPLYEVRQADQRAEYLATAREIGSRIRAVTWPISPIDLVAGLLRAAWPPGVRTFALDGRLCADGVVRSLQRGGAIEAHIDDPVADTENHPDATSIQATLSALTYLDVPAVGGELRLWDRRLTAEEERHARRVGSEYALDEAVIGSPAAIIKPEPGDLVIFCASRPHAVTPFVEGRRITISTFVNFHSEDHPLSLHA
jgi:hypothetical protein